MRLRREVKFILAIILLFVILHWSGAFYYLDNKNIGVDNIKIVQFILFYISTNTIIKIGKQLVAEEDNE
jgi:hypothetical protein